LLEVIIHSFRYSKSTEYFAQVFVQIIEKLELWILLDILIKVIQVSHPQSLNPFGKITWQTFEHFVVLEVHHHDDEVED